MRGDPDLRPGSHDGDRGRAQAPPTGVQRAGRARAAGARPITEQPLRPHVPVLRGGRGFRKGEEPLEVSQVARCRGRPPGGAGRGAEGGGSCPWSVGGRCPGAGGRCPPEQGRDWRGGGRGAGLGAQHEGAAHATSLRWWRCPPGGPSTAARAVVCPGDARLAHLQRGGVHGGGGPRRRRLQGRGCLPALPDQGGVVRTAGVHETGLQAPGRSCHFELRQRRPVSSR